MLLIGDKRYFIPKHSKVGDWVAIIRIISVVCTFISSVIGIANNLVLYYFFQVLFRLLITNHRKLIGPLLLHIEILLLQQLFIFRRTIFELGLITLLQLGNILHQIFIFLFNQVLNIVIVEYFAPFLGINGRHIPVLLQLEIVVLVDRLLTALSVDGLAVTPHHLFLELLVFGLQVLRAVCRHMLLLVQVDKLFYIVLFQVVFVHKIEIVVVRSVQNLFALVNWRLILRWLLVRLDLLRHVISRVGLILLSITLRWRFLARFFLVVFLVQLLQMFELLKEIKLFIIHLP